MGRPRIRTIKPEIWHSRDFQSLTAVGRLAFLALISNSDDEGRLKTDPGHLVANYLVGAGTPDEVAVQLERMEERGMLVAYQVRGDHFVALRGWEKHQRVSHSVPSDVPAPPKFKRSGTPNKRQIDLNFRRSSPEDSGLARAPIRSRSGPDPVPSPSTPAAADAALLVVVPSAVDEVFEAWRTRWHPAARLTKDRKARIQARLKDGFTVADLVLAVTDGAAADPWEERHVGLNDDLAHLLRSVERVEKFLELARAPASVLPAAKRSLSTAYREQAAVLRERGE